VGDQVSHPYKTRQVAFLYILILHSKEKDCTEISYENFRTVPKEMTVHIHFNFTYKLFSE